jgi:hypothetical protein
MNETPLRGTSKSPLPPLYQANCNQEYDATQANSSSTPNSHNPLNQSPSVQQVQQQQRRPSSLGIIDQTVLDVPHWFQSSAMVSTSELPRVKPGTLGFQHKKERVA